MQNSNSLNSNNILAKNYLFFNLMVILDKEMLFWEIAKIFKQRMLLFLWNPNRQIFIAINNSNSKLFISHIYFSSYRGTDARSYKRI